MTLDREITAEESAALSQSQGQEPRAPEMPANIPNLLSTIEENHLKVAPVKNAKGDVTGYDINSRGGRQLFRISPDDMTFALVKDTILAAAADKEEVSSTFEIMEGIQCSLRRLGMPESDIPTTPHEIAEQALTLMNDFGRIQQAKSEIDIQNNLQAFLGMSERTFAGGKKEWDKLSHEQQRLVMVFGDTLLVRALEKLGVGEGTINAAVAMETIENKLLGIRREAAWYNGLGKALKGLASSAVNTTLGEGGILEGVITNGDTLVGKAIERTAEVAGRAKTGVVTNWKANQNSKLEE